MPGTRRNSVSGSSVPRNRSSWPHRPKREHLADGLGDPRTDRGQRVQPLRALALQDVAEVLVETGDRVRRVPVGPDPEGVGPLLLEEVSGLVEPVGDELVRESRRAQRGGRLGEIGGEAQVNAKPKLSHPLISV